MQGNAAVDEIERSRFERRNGIGGIHQITAAIGVTIPLLRAGHHACGDVASRRPTRSARTAPASTAPHRSQNRVPRLASTTMCCPAAPVMADVISAAGREELSSDPICCRDSDRRSGTALKVFLAERLINALDPLESHHRHDTISRRCAAFCSLSCWSRARSPGPRRSIRGGSITTWADGYASRRPAFQGWFRATYSLDAQPAAVGLLQARGALRARLARRHPARPVVRRHRSRSLTCAAALHATSAWASRAGRRRSSSGGNV